MSPKFIRVAGKLYRRADLDVIQETQGRDCGCGGTAVKVKPEEADIALKNLDMEGFLTRRCPETDAICADEPPTQPERVIRPTPIGGDPITTRMKQNWPSSSLKPHQGSAAPEYIKVNGRVYARTAARSRFDYEPRDFGALESNSSSRFKPTYGIPSAPQLAAELEKVYAQIHPLIARAVQSGDDKRYALQRAIKSLADAAANLVLAEDQQLPRPRP